MPYEVCDIRPEAAHLTTSLSDIYTCPAGKVAEIKAALVANVDGAADADVSVARFRASDSDTFYYAKAETVPAKAGLKVMGDMVGLRLLAGDKIQALASADGDLDLHLSITVFTPPAA